MYLCCDEESVIQRSESERLWCTKLSLSNAVISGSSAPSLMPVPTLQRGYTGNSYRMGVLTGVFISKV